jgi:hypothetical protein
MKKIDLKKIDKRIWWSLPILLGVYLIFRQYSKKSSSAQTQTNTGLNLNNNKPLKQELFPIKKGDKDPGAPSNPKGKVVDLQRLINVKGYIPSNQMYSGKPTVKLIEDGIFGSKTEEALKFYINTPSIDSQDDVDYLKSVIFPSMSVDNSSSDYNKDTTIFGDSTNYSNNY